MTDQFDVIEAGERGRRRWIGLVVVLALLLVPVIGLLASRDPEPPGPGPATAAPDPIQSLTRIDSVPNMLHPPASTKAGLEVIQVTFPDGRRAEVRYPPELELSEMGVRPYQGVRIDGQYRPLVAPYSGAIEVTRGGKPIRSFAPNVTLWPHPPGSGTFGEVLLFEFGPWRMTLEDRQDGLTFEQRAAAAEHLRGKVTKDGSLVLSGGGNVELAGPGETERGRPVGPQLWFGGGAVSMVALVPTPNCAKLADRLPVAIIARGRPTSSVCTGDVLVAVAGPEEFRAKALAGIRITLK
ncbi:hypothetical protein HII36_37365 [Nonomuraea sp. NN258]|uniref:hypothetical protein n=1 Tax=Nonomuraea antri TaxID=2730852 RepID=UPI00156A5A0D|nr:hypothetical protein [Nonomuraea antri]NRQ37464.1 hypothetical protein [Nonomuraea antri]